MPAALVLDDFIMQIKSTLSRSENLSTRHNTAAARIHPTELPADLLDSTHLLVRRDGLVLPLAPLYNGPYAVLCRANQHFTIQMGSRVEVISTSRLAWYRRCHTGAADREVSRAVGVTSPVSC